MKFFTSAGNVLVTFALRVAHRPQFAEIGYRLLALMTWVVCLPIALCVGVARMTRARPSMPRSVFVGVHGMVGLVHRICATLQAAGIRTQHLIIYPGRFVDKMPTDYWSRLRRRVSGVLHLPRILISADLVYFVSINSLLPYRLDYFLFWLSRARLLVQHTGSDVRFDPIQNELMERLGLAKRYPGRTFSWAKFFVHCARQFSAELFGTVLCLRNAATLQVSPLVRGMFPVEGDPVARDPGEIPTVIHAPSSRDRKNTAEIQKSIEILRRAGLRFEFLLLENIPQDELMSNLGNADIVVDARDTWIGLLGVESLARSCVVVGGANSDFEDMPASPIVDFPNSAEELAMVLEGLIRDTSLRRKLMHESWAFWKENYSPEAFMQFLQRVWNSSEPAFTPHPERKLVLRKTGRVGPAWARFEVGLASEGKDHG